jgi:hypothetical protein
MFIVRGITGVPMNLVTGEVFQPGGRLRQPCELMQQGVNLANGGLQQGL